MKLHIYMNKYQLLRYFLSVLILIVSFPISSKISNLTQRRINKKIGKNGNRGNFIVVYSLFFLRTVIILMSMTIALRVSNLNPTIFYSTLGILGLIVPLTIQMPIQDLACGVFIILFDKFRVGDYVKNIHAEGNVISINAFYTEVNTLKGIEEIPNSEMWKNSIQNFSRGKISVINIEFVISNVNDFNFVSKVIHNYLKKEKKIISKPKIILKRSFQLDHSSGGQNISIRCEVKKQHFESLNESLPETLYVELQNKGILFLDGRKPVSLNNKYNYITPILLNHNNQIII